MDPTPQPQQTRNTRHPRLPLAHGSYELNPPFVVPVMDAAAARAEALLAAANAAGAPLSFVAVVPGWREAQAWAALCGSRYLRKQVVVAAADHGARRCGGARGAAVRVGGRRRARQLRWGARQGGASGVAAAGARGTVLFPSRPGHCWPRPTPPLSLLAGVHHPTTHPGPLPVPLSPCRRNLDSPPCPCPTSNLTSDSSPPPRSATFSVLSSLPPRTPPAN